MAALVDIINNIQTTKDNEQDVVGRVYEYFLSKFALKEGKGEFYTPKCIVNLIDEMIESYKGKIYSRHLKGWSMNYKKLGEYIEIVSKKIMIFP